MVAGVPRWPRRRWETPPDAERQCARAADGGRFGRSPVLLLTTTGQRSGKPRYTAVLYGKDGGRLVVIAVQAREVEGIERTQKLRVIAAKCPGLWQLMSEQYLGFDVYRTRTTRNLKVFLLDPL